MDEALPTFTYHPNPAATGAVKMDGDTPCLSCSRLRGYDYDGPAFSEKFHYLSHILCPWCIANGSAAKQFDANFVDTLTIAGVDEKVTDEIAHRTPGFEAWQQEQWLTCCGDAAGFLGAAGAARTRVFPSARPLRSPRSPSRQRTLATRCL